MLLMRRCCWLLALTMLPGWAGLPGRAVWAAVHARTLREAAMPAHASIDGRDCFKRITEEGCSVPAEAGWRQRRVA